MAGPGGPVVGPNPVPAVCERLSDAARGHGLDGNASGPSVGHGQRPDAGRARTRWIAGAVSTAVAIVLGIGVGRALTVLGGDAAVVPAAEPDPLAAVVALQTDAERSPEDADVRRRLATAAVRAAALGSDPALYEVARDALAEAGALDPDDPRTLVVRGHLELALHRFQRAAVTGERALASLPRNPDALGILVDATVELGDYAAAAAYVQEMLDVDPGLPALARASYLRELHGDLDGAIVAMQQAAAAGAQQPLDAAVTLALLGDLHRQTGELDAAAEAYREAARSAPGLPAAALGSARVDAATGDLAASRERVAAVVERFPTLEAVGLLADLHRLAGDEDAAAEAVALGGAIADLATRAGQTVDLELARFEIDRGDPVRGLELARAAYAARPDNVHVRDTLAWALFRTGDADAALPHAEAAGRLGTRDPVVRFHRAAIEAAVGRTEAARTTVAELARVTPWFDPALLDEAAALAAALGVDAPPAWADAAVTGR